MEVRKDCPHSPEMVPLIEDETEDVMVVVMEDVMEVLMVFVRVAVILSKVH